MSLTRVMEKSGTILTWSFSARKVSSSGVSAGWSVLGRAIGRAGVESASVRGCKGSRGRALRVAVRVFASVDRSVVRFPASK